MAKPEIISSPKNPLLKDIRRAAMNGTMTSEGYCLAETFHLLEEAIRSDCTVKLVLAAESVRSTVESRIRGLRGIRMAVVPDELFEDLSATESAQGVLTLVKPPSWTLDHLFRGQSLVVILDGIQDPGNAGAIVRSAEAFGASGVLFTKGSVNPWNPKTLRASAGSLFRMPMVAGLDSVLTRAALDQRRTDTYALMPREGKSLKDADLTRRCALIVGSEGRGVSDRLSSGALDLSIPTTNVESLNASIAAAVVLYEAHRQRLAAP